MSPHYGKIGAINAESLFIWHDISLQKRTEQATKKCCGISSTQSRCGRNCAGGISGGTADDVLKLFSAGKNSPELAKEIRISLQALRGHLLHINPKLPTRN